MRLYFLFIFYALFLNSMVAQNIKFDDQTRVIEVDYGSGYKIQYTYDNLGNITQKSVTAGCYALTSNEYLQMGFEHGIAPWGQLNTDDENWTVYEGSSPSNNTGPSSASNLKQYAYIEGTGNQNKYFELESPCLDLSGQSDPFFSIDYHMWGSGTGNLSVEVSYDGGTGWSVLMPLVSGNQGNAWQTFSAPVTPSASTIIRVIAQAGSSGTSDIAIDNIKIGEPDCFQDLTLTTATDPLYQAADFIETSGTVPVNVGQNTTFRSQAIFLKPGFHSKSGSIHRSHILPCSN